MCLLRVSHHGINDKIMYLVSYPTPIHTWVEIASLHVNMSYILIRINLGLKLASNVRILTIINAHTVCVNDLIKIVTV